MQAPDPSTRSLLSIGVARQTGAFTESIVLESIDNLMSKSKTVFQNRGSIHADTAKRFLPLAELSITMS